MSESKQIKFLSSLKDETVILNEYHQHAIRKENFRRQFSYFMGLCSVLGVVTTFDSRHAAIIRPAAFLVNVVCMTYLRFGSDSGSIRQHHMISDKCDELVRDIGGTEIRPGESTERLLPLSDRLMSLSGGIDYF